MTTPTDTPTEVIELPVAFEWPWLLTRGNRIATTSSERAGQHIALCINEYPRLKAELADTQEKLALAVEGLERISNPTSDVYVLALVAMPHGEPERQYRSHYEALNMAYTIAQSTLKTIQSAGQGE